MSAFTSCLQTVQSRQLGLWWLQFPNGFLMRQSHLSVADEGCASQPPLPHLSQADGEWLGCLPLCIDHFFALRLLVCLAH